MRHPARTIEPRAQPRLLLLENGDQSVAANNRVLVLQIAGALDRRGPLNTGLALHGLDFAANRGPEAGFVAEVG